MAVEPLGNIPKGRLHHPFEHARCCVHKTLTLQDVGSAAVRDLFLVTGVRRQEIIHGKEASVYRCLAAGRAGWLSGPQPRRVGVADRAHHRQRTTIVVQVA